LNIRYYIDPQTGAPHIHNHRASEDEVEAVLARPGEDRPGAEGARIAVGQTSAGRYLRVIYVPEVGGVFVITAYELTANLYWPTGAGSAENDEQTYEVS
jgi:hypothetical protein